MPQQPGNECYGYAVGLQVSWRNANDQPSYFPLTAGFESGSDEIDIVSHHELLPGIYLIEGSFDKTSEVPA